MPEGKRDFEIRDDNERVITVPDFAWPEIKLAVYCDGFAVHVKPVTLELDARKRNFLQSQGWVVLTYWGKTILHDPQSCASQIEQIWKQKSKRKKQI
ncbi:MAG: endonuclease domain-containing protein [Desulfobaccales bacterium]